MPIYPPYFHIFIINQLKPLIFSHLIHALLLSTCQELDNLHQASQALKNMLQNNQATIQDVQNFLTNFESLVNPIKQKLANLESQIVSIDLELEDKCRYIQRYLRNLDAWRFGISS